MPLARLGPVPRSSPISWVEIEMARAMTYRAAAAAARDPLGALHLSSMAKVGATEIAGRVVDRCVQVMGRFGLVRGTKIERLYRDARPMRIYEGSTEVILDSLARKLVKDVASGRSRGASDDHRRPHARLAGPHRRSHAGATPGRDAAAVRRHPVRAASHHGRGRASTRAWPSASASRRRPSPAPTSSSARVPRDRLVPMGTVHPDCASRRTSSRLKDNGIVGVKLHPLFQALSLDDPRVHDILAALAEEGMPVVTHVGCRRGRRRRTSAARPRRCGSSPTPSRT